MRRLILLAFVACSFALAQGTFGVRAVWDYSDGLSTYVFIERSVFQFGPVDIVAGAELDSNLTWAAYSAINLFLDNAFVQLSWSNRYLAFRVVYTW